MGAWAGGLFESDADLDIISDLSQEVGVELLRDGDDAEPAVGMIVSGNGGIRIGSSNGRSFDEDNLLSIKHSREHLDAGNFKSVFDKYMAMKETPYLFSLSCPPAGGAYCCVLLAAAAMRVGATITDEQRAYLKSQYRGCGLMKEGIEQMEQALQKYESGKPYKLIEPDRSEQEGDMRARKADAERTGRILMANHFGERFFEDGKGTPDFMTLWNRKNEGKPSDTSGIPTTDRLQTGVCARCKKVDFMLDGGRKLKNCAKCKGIMYCSRECQKQDWKHHKKDCARLAAEGAK